MRGVAEPGAARAAGEGVFRPRTAEALATPGPAIDGSLPEGYLVRQVFLTDHTGHAVFCHLAGVAALGLATQGEHIASLRPPLNGPQARAVVQSGAADRVMSDVVLLLRWAWLSPDEKYWQYEVFGRARRADLIPVALLDLNDHSPLFTQNRDAAIGTVAAAAGPYLWRLQHAR